MNFWIKSQLVFCAALLAFPSDGFAAPGNLDTSFGIGGRGFADVVGADSAQARAVAMQIDGKIVVAGNCVVAATLSLQMCAIRVMPNGFFDTGFGTSGTKLINVGTTGAVEVVNAMAIQPDGKIVLAGACGPETSPTEICLARLQGDGSLDPGFGLSGKARISFPGTGEQEARAVTILPSGKILLGGRCAANNPLDAGVCVVRLNSDGTLDTSFASSGRSVAISGFNERLTDLLVRPDGRIVIATEPQRVVIPGPSPYFVYVSQLTSAGSWDSSFGIGGTYTRLDESGDRTVPRLALQPDGKLIVATIIGNFQKGFRLNTDGSADSTYDYPNFPFGGLPTIRGEFGLKPLVQTDGKTIYVTTATPGSLSGTPPEGTLDFAVFRSFDIGGLDTTFSRGTTTMLAASDRANDAALQADGKLVVVGACDTGTKFQMCVARFEAASAAARNCTMDIDGDGKVLATTDALILARVSLGLSGAHVLNGVSIVGTRNTWPLIRDYLVSQCGMTNIAP